jgi:pyrroloquinoline quinone biosynthesis protein D
MMDTGENNAATRGQIEGASILRFAPHAKFRFDEVRQAWIVLAPERLLLPDKQAVEILNLIDGERDVDTVIDELARRYEAPRAVIAVDVVAMLQDLVDKKVLRR